MKLSPVQFAAMRERLEAVDRPRGRVLELLLAQLTAMVANTGFRAFDPPLQAKDFLVTERSKPEAKPRRTNRVRDEAAENWAMGMWKLMQKQK